jgi:hypothetical protein
MSDYDDDLPRRENLMQRRLRKARGEDVDDDPEPYNSYEDEQGYAPRSLGGGYSAPRGGYAQPSGAGCAQVSLYLVVGALLALVIVGIFFSRAFGSIGQIFQPPSVAEILATPTPEIISGAAVVQRIQQLSKLETAQYTVETVIEVNQSQGNPIFDFFAGDALLLIAHGTVVAGVDLGTLTPESVTVAPDGSTITVRLPPAEIFSTSLDNSRTRVYTRDRGFFAPDNANLETLARQEAEARILQAACEDGVLIKATDQAETALRQSLGLVDEAEIIVVAATPSGCPARGAPAVTPTP